ncbi:hypothetical protein [Rhodococcus qingshengii]|uniref:hypothetical protein n=1 Tax=Rhodococcus qingshengii TaxID=334542 RepID=UPI001268F597|nr:hypothetical protein [Rhodococcus qingshengii]
MSLAEGTRVVGRVDGIGPNGNRAWITPLCQKIGQTWRPSRDPADFPNNGQVYWHEAHAVQKFSVWFFELKANMGSGKDRFLVRNPREACRVMDFRDHGEVELIARIASGPLPVRSGIVPGEVFLWCAGDVILGPFHVKIHGDQSTLEATQPERVRYWPAESNVVALPDGTVYVDNLLQSASIGHADCRSDHDVLRQALREAVGLVGDAIEDRQYATSKKALEEAARRLRSGENTAERELVVQRLTRALDICEDSATLRALAQQLAEQLLIHPQIAEELAVRKAQVEAEVRTKAKEEASAAARHEIDLAFASQRAVLEEAQTQATRTRAELEQVRVEVQKAESRRAELQTEIDAAELELTEAKASAHGQLHELEDSVRHQVDEILEGTSSALAQSVVLRALGAGEWHTKKQLSGTTTVRLPQSAAENPYSETVSEYSTVADESLGRHLSRAARSWGLSRLVLERIHASVRAGLVPVLTGNGGMTALRAYAAAVFAGRIAVLPVAHDFLHPVDLLGVQASEPSIFRPHSGLLEAAIEATSGKSGMLVLESLNRAPTESYLLPWLQNQPQQINGPFGSSVELHRGLAVAATAASGATTAPLSPDIWGHAVAIDVPNYPRTGVVSNIAGLAEPTALPRDAVREAKTQLTDLVDGLDENWPIDPGVFDTANRFAAGLAEMQSTDEIAISVVACVLLPALSTVLSGDDLDAAAEQIIERLDNLEDGHARKLRTLTLRLHGRFA